MNIPDTLNPVRQRGGATLLVALALVIAIVALAISLGHTSALEQRMSRNNLLANQTRLAAIAGLNFGIAWLKTQRPAWILGAGGIEIATPDRNPPPISTASGASFAINVTFERRPAWRGYIRVRSSSVPANAPEVEVHVAQFVRPTSVLTAAGEEAAPLIIAGCGDLSALSDLYPLAADTPDSGTAVASSGDAACITTGTANLHNGGVQAQAFAETDLWNYVFTVSRSELETLAADQAALGLPPGQRDYWWAQAADLSGGEWRQSLGRSDRPVVLFIPADLGCPRFSGGVLLVGLVFIEADCSGAPAWGDTRIYGSLVVRGQFDALGPTSRLFHISHAPDGARRIEPPPLEAVPLAGSWRDF